MSVEELITRLRNLEREISEIDREELLSKLRVQLTLDGRPRPTELKSKGDLYFHSIQDLRLAKVVENLEEKYRDKKGCEYPQSEETFFHAQACFLQDLDRYLELLPNNENNRQIIDSLNLIRRVGTSALWYKDRELMNNLLDLYVKLDDTLIRPWINITD
jgi:hypothetical protein